MTTEKRRERKKKKSQIPFLFISPFLTGKRAIYSGQKKGKKKRHKNLRSHCCWSGPSRARREEVTAKEEKKLFESYKEKRNNSYIEKNF
jgi:hypothetical protein